MAGPRSMSGDPLEGARLAGFAGDPRAGKRSSEAITRAYLDRIARLDSILGSYQHVAAESALRSARAVGNRDPRRERISDRSIPAQWQQPTHRPLWGLIENRARFLLEAVDAVIPVWGRDRVGVRLSPFGRDGDMIDSDGFAIWRHTARELCERCLAYLHLVEPRADKSSDVNALHPDAPDAAGELKDVFGGPLISAGGYVGETARAAILSGKADAVAFGRLFIANPDLAKRLRVNAPMNRHHRPSFYGGSEVGYTDYPFLKDIQVPLQTSAEFVRTYSAQAHEIVDAITAAVISAEAGLNWLRTEPPDLEEVRQVLNSSPMRKRCRAIRMTGIPWPR
jgi:hypothetical protein